MEDNFAKPVNSHLIMYGNPKVAVVNGFIERVFGLLLSQYMDSSGKVVTNRTLLVNEELEAQWNVCSDDDDSLRAVRYFKDFPNLTMKDVSSVIHSTVGVRDLCDSFSDLADLGCVIPQGKEEIVMSVSSNKGGYEFYCREFGSITSYQCWIPTAIDYLYSIQSFLGRRIVLVCQENSGISQREADMMNELLGNQLANKVFIAGEFGEVCHVNDGVHTYGTDGTKVAMTREEFVSKYPDAYEALG